MLIAFPSANDQTFSIIQRSDIKVIPKERDACF